MLPIQPVDATAQPVYVQPPQPVYAQPGQPVYAQPAQPVYVQSAQPQVTIVQPKAIAAQVVMTAPVPEHQQRESVPGFGFCPDYEYKNSARNLAGFYMACTGSPIFWFHDPCPMWILCCPSPLYVPYPCPGVRCLKYEAVDDDTLKLTCGACMCCPLNMCDSKESGALYRRDDGENGRPWGPPNAFTREDGKNTFEVGQYRLCGATLGMCYLRLF